MTDHKPPSPGPSPATLGPRVPESLRPPTQKLANSIQSLTGGHFIGLTVYGPALEEGFDPHRMQAESVFVVDQVDLDVLRRLSETGGGFAARSLAAPVVLTPEHITASLDTFPLELIEISRLRATIAGQDSFADLRFTPEHVRLQCERELKRVLIQMRQGLLTAEGRERALTDLQRDIGRNLLRTLVGLAWLHGHHLYMPAGDVVALCERTMNLSLGGVRSALHWDGPHGWQEFAALYHDVEGLAAHSNAM